MAATELEAGSRPGLGRRPDGFLPFHAGDRNFFLAAAAAIWIAVLVGFGVDVAFRVLTHAPPFPLIVHVHAVVFVGWVTLFTVQVALIRARRPEVHRRLGFAMIGLAVVMIGVGPATAIIVDRLMFGTPAGDPVFLAVQLTDIVAFAGLVGAAVVLRGDSPAHKRLVLLATLYITDAAFGRLTLPLLGPRLPPGLLSSWFVVYAGPDLLMLAIGGYDLVTRRRLHPAYVFGMAYVLGIQVTASGLLYAPAWRSFAPLIVGR